MKLPPERVAELNMRRREYKWSLILAQVYIIIILHKLFPK